MKSNGLGVCLTFYNSSDYLLDALWIPLLDSRVGEIVIYDDGSSRIEKDKLIRLINGLQDKSEIGIYKSRYPETKARHRGGFQSHYWSTNIDIGDAFKKIKLVSSNLNLGAFKAKMNAVENSKSEFVLLLDGDNHLVENSISAIINSDICDDEILFPNVAFMNTHIYLPWDHYNNRYFGYQRIGETELRNFLNQQTNHPRSRVENLINLGNYAFNRDRYLEVARRYEKFSSWAGTRDAMLLVLGWIKSGYQIRIAPEYFYFHRLHQNSFVARSKEKSATAEEILAEILN